jgi:hypothetical protein
MCFFFLSLQIDAWYNDKQTSATNKFIIETYKNYKEHGFSISDHDVAGFYKGCNTMYRPSQIEHNGPNKQ